MPVRKFRSVSNWPFLSRHLNEAFVCQGGQIVESFTEVRMRTFNLAVCTVTFLLAGSFCWGQAMPVGNSRGEPAATSAASTPGIHAENQPGSKAIVAPDAAVITIAGLCDNSRKSDGTAGCTTIITRAEFETIVAAVQPNMSPRAKPQFANEYADDLVMMKKAEELGLDKGPRFDEQMKVARIEILVRELKNLIREQANQVSEKQIAEYYSRNAASFEEADLDRIYVPVIESPASSNPSDNAQQRQKSDALTKALAEQLHARAVAGEDFTKLQQEAYQKAGIKSSASVSVAKVRRLSLPPSHVVVMDLKLGEMSAVLAGSNGYYIYRMRSRETLSLDAARDEIRGIIRSQHLQEEMRRIEESATSTLNESYFYPSRTSSTISRAAP